MNEFFHSLMTEGSGSGARSGSVPLTNGSGFRSRSPKNIGILRIRIHNTCFHNFSLFKISVFSSSRSGSKLNSLENTVSGSGISWIRNAKRRWDLVGKRQLETLVELEPLLEEELVGVLKLVAKTRGPLPHRLKRREKIRLIESNAKCRYLKKFTCKWT
jgi:hypothetical protein